MQQVSVCQPFDFAKISSLSTTDCEADPNQFSDTILLLMGISSSTYAGVKITEK